MSTNDPVVRKRSKHRWVIPLFAVVMGLAYLVAGLLGDDPGFGVFGLILMLCVALAFVLLSRYSETVAGLMDRRDERINRMETDASVFAGMTVLAAILVAFVVEIAKGEDGAPYFMLGSIGAVAYIAAMIFLRFRR